MTANCERKFDRVWQEQWWSSASLSSQSRWRRKQIKISRDERQQLSSPCQTVDVALASEPGLDRPSGTDDLQALDQVLRGENISILRKYFIIIIFHLAVQREPVTPPVVHTGDGLQTLWMESSRSSQGGLGLEIRVDFGGL